MHVMLFFNNDGLPSNWSDKTAKQASTMVSNTVVIVTLAHDIEQYRPRAISTEFMYAEGKRGTIIIISWKQEWVIKDLGVLWQVYEW